jgi:uncharacterized protein YaeQ
MAQAATVYSFEIQLSDMDRGVYESLALRVARQPSETAEYLLTRVLAYCLEYVEGLTFSRGLAEPDEPGLAVRDLTGALQVWIDIGAVYTHKDAANLVRQLGEARIHRADALEVYGVDRALLAALAARLERRMGFALAVSDRHLYLTLGDDSLSGAVTRHPISAD